MKKLFITIVALGSMVSCIKDDVVNKSKMPITFGGTFVEDVTRAVQDPSYGDAKLIDQFTVWGVVTGNVGSANLYGGDGTVVSRGGAAYGSPFASTEQEWWISNADYKFAAVANHTSVTLANGLPSSIKYTANGTADLIYAQPVAVETDAKAAPARSTGIANVGVNTNDCVPFVFSHLLSKVQFTFVSTSQPLVVTEIKVTSGHFSEGTYSIGTETWDSTTAATTAMEFGNADGTVTTAGTTSQYARLIIPGTQTLNISFKQGDEVMTPTLENFTFEPNKAYNILVTLQGASAITFVINTLEAWGVETDVPLDF